jgi:MOSC domain-containing protein YiiM
MIDQQRGVVTSVNISAKKGTRKTPVESGSARILLGSGVEGDAHAGEWHRQVSFLAEESIAKARAMGLDVKAGDFAENITTEGINLLSIPIGSLLRVGTTEVEISQIGKVCHTRCAIYHLAGDCIFPREGIFSYVRTPGEVSVGDTIEVVSVGDGHCDATPQEAIDEIEAARAAGTL